MRECWDSMEVEYNMAGPLPEPLAAVAVTSKETDRVTPIALLAGGSSLAGFRAPYCRQIRTPAVA